VSARTARPSIGSRIPRLPDDDQPAVIHGLDTTVVDGVRVCVCHREFWSVCPGLLAARRAGGAR
jgi:hypothetical protein